MKIRVLILLTISFILLFVSACQPSADDQSDQVTTPTAENAIPSYPEPGNNPGYPIPTRQLPEGLLDTPPNPERDLPDPEGAGATLGGVLIREILEEGFLPFIPVSLILGEVIYSTDGRPGFIASSANALRAELFPTGIFVFRNVPPGEYGLVVDLAYTSFPILDESGIPQVINLETGQVLDLGQVITIVPGSS